MMPIGLVLKMSIGEQPILLKKKIKILINIKKKKNII